MFGENYYFWLILFISVLQLFFNTHLSESSSQNQPFIRAQHEIIQMGELLMYFFRFGTGIYGSECFYYIYRIVQVKLSNLLIVFWFWELVFSKNI
jgi:hypothetical protein